MENSVLSNIVEWVKKSAIYLLMFMVNVLLVTTILFFVKVTITPYHLPIIYVLTTAVFVLFYKKSDLRSKIIPIIIGTVLLLTSIWTIGKIYDTTADGNTYHKLAIGAMKNGWNPAYESTRDFSIEKGNVFDVSDDNINALWADHYAKATEIYGAVIYAFTGNIESGKGYTLLFMYICFAIIGSYLYKNKKMNVLASIAIGIVIAFNPITISQIGNYYVDGALMMSLFLIIYSCFVLGEEEEKEFRKETLFVLAGSIIWCINAKFTGLAFAGIFCFVFYCYHLFRSYKKDKEQFKKHLLQYTSFYIVTVILSVGVIGFSSYTKNMIDHGHPLYPLAGEGHVDNMVVMEQPKSFADKNHIEIFLISLFAKGENVSPSYSDQNVQPELKIPFTFTEEEVKNYTIPDIRMAGFGPLFSGVFVISVIVTIITIIQLIRKKKYHLWIPYIMVIGIIAALLIALDGNYWARYIPYVFALPIISLIYLLYDSKNKVKMGIGWIIILIMLVNAGLVFTVTCKSLLDNRAYVAKKIQEFQDYSSTRETVEVKLNHWGLQGVLYNLDDRDIHNYTVVNQIENGKEGFFFVYQ